MEQNEKPQSRRYRFNPKKLATTLLTLGAMVAIIAVAAVALNNTGASAAVTQPPVSAPAGTVRPGSTPGTSNANAAPNSGDGLLVLVDPGHGGFDPGAIGITGAHEADLNLAVAFCLKTELEANGMQVIMTRDSDDGLGTTQKESLATRRQIIEQSDSDIVISIHMNSYKDDPSVSGPIALFMPGSDRGKALAEALQQSLNDSLGVEGSARSEDLYVLRSGNQPCALVECGFLSNEDEEHAMQQPDYQQKLAKAICDGVVQYFSKQ